MAITSLEYIFAGYWLLQTLSAAVSAMPAPTKPGWYSWVYQFTHSMTGNLDSFFERRFGIPIQAPVSDYSSSPTDGGPQRSASVNPLEKI